MRPDRIPDFIRQVLVSSTLADSHKFDDIRRSGGDGTSIPDAVNI
jgi:hypothetical protein